jgi:molybdopterin-guanine dinucleotide biosynthesis protein A
MEFDAVVLAGGSGRRLGGTDKALIEIGGVSLLRRSLDAVAGAASVIVAGPERPGIDEVHWVHESPAGAGPVHALAAALERVVRESVVVLAVDHPFVTAELVGRLVAATKRGDGAIITSRGRDQYLVGAYRSSALRRAFTSLGDTRGASMRGLLSQLNLERITDERAAIDCDTWAQIEEARDAGRVG